MKHFGEHLAVYWNSLTAARKKPNGEVLGKFLQCPVFVINLERSPHRRDYMIQHLASHGINARIFPAVDGSKIDVGEVERQGIYADSLAHQKFSRSLSKNEIACTLSHLNIHRRMIEENIDMAMVLEDDAMFTPEIADRVRGALSEAPEEWDLLQMSHNCQEHVQFTKHLVKFPSNTRMPVGSAGYLIRKSGAEKLLANGFPICYPADSFFGRCPRWGVVLYGFAPPVIVQNAVFPTQIYSPPSWGVTVTQYLKQGFVSVFAAIAKLLGGSKQKGSE